MMQLSLLLSMTSMLLRMPITSLTWGRATERRAAGSSPAGLRMKSNSQMKVSPGITNTRLTKGLRELEDDGWVLRQGKPRAAEWENQDFVPGRRSGIRYSYFTGRSYG